MTGVNQGSHCVVVVELGGGNVVVCISSGQGGSVAKKGFKSKCFKFAELFSSKYRKHLSIFEITLMINMYMCHIQ